MMKLAAEAGFTGLKIIPTSGKPGVFGRLDAGAKNTLAVYFMYDVKQFVPEEWSSPPLEGRLVERAGREPEVEGAVVRRPCRGRARGTGRHLRQRVHRRPGGRQWCLGSLPAPAI